MCILHRWGIHTLGQFAALDKEEVGTRLGPIGLQLWDRAKGKNTRLLKLVRHRSLSRKHSNRERNRNGRTAPLYSAPISPPIIPSARSALPGRQLSFGLQITFNDKSAYEHQFKIPEPTNNGEVLFRMLHMHLENFNLTSDYCSRSEGRGNEAILSTIQSV